MVPSSSAAAAPEPAVRYDRDSVVVGRGERGLEPQRPGSRIRAAGCQISQEIPVAGDDPAAAVGLHGLAEDLAEMDVTVGPRQRHVRTQRERLVERGLEREGPTVDRVAARGHTAKR